MRVVNGQVAEYMPPEKQFDPFEEGDYRKTALQAVEQLAGSPA